MTGVRLIQIAAVYMVVGLGLGLAMGISGNFSQMSVHAHILLLGWATMAVAGIVYLVIPGCGRSRLAALHAWGHNLGLPVMMVGLALEESGQAKVAPVIAAGSTLVLVSLVLFAVNLFRNGGLHRASDDRNEVPLRTQATGKL